MHHLFSCMSENSLLGQVELRACAIFLENLTGDCFFTHAWSPQCVFFRDGKLLLEAGGILRLCIGHCFATHAWCPLCVFFRAGKCLLEAGGILSLFNYSWTVGLQIVSLGTHGL